MTRSMKVAVAASLWIKSLATEAKLSHRLAGGFGFLLLMMVLTVGLALFQMGQMQQQMRLIVESNVARIAAAQAMMDAVNGVSVATLGFAFSNDPEDVKFQLQEVQSRLAVYDSAQSHFEALSTFNGVNAIQADMRERLETWERTTRDLAEAVARTASSGGNAAFALASLYPQKVQVAWAKDIQVLVQAEQAQCTATYEAARDSFVQIRTLLLGVTVAALLIGAFAAWTILRSVTRPLQQAVEHAERISLGDLSVDIDARGADEVAGLLRVLASMQDQLRRMIGQVRDASDEIRSATAVVSAGGGDLSSRTEETASNLQQTAASMDNLVTLVDRGALAGQQAKQWAGEATDVAGKGGAVMGNVVSTMEDIDQSSRRIGQIVGVIDSIAFQTNILALNAAVEAARAGEQGRGFAVVATEVRSLAGRCAEAAREIRTLIANSVERIDSGAQLVRSAGSTMSDIVAAVQRMNDAIEDISSTLEEQRQSMREVSAAMSQVDRLTQQNAALAEESAASTVILDGQSARLEEAVRAFKG